MCEDERIAKCEDCDRWFCDEHGNPNAQPTNEPRVQSKCNACIKLLAGAVWSLFPRPHLFRPPSPKLYARDERTAKRGRKPAEGEADERLAAPHCLVHKRLVRDSSEGERPGKQQRRFSRFTNDPCTSCGRRSEKGNFRCHDCLEACCSACVFVMVPPIGKYDGQTLCHGCFRSTNEPEYGEYSERFNEFGESRKECHDEGCFCEEEEHECWLVARERARYESESD